MKQKKKILFIILIVLTILLLSYLIFILIVKNNNNLTNSTDIKENIKIINNETYKQIEIEDLMSKEYNYDGIVINNIKTYHNNKGNYITFNIQNLSEDVFTKRSFILTLYNKDNIEIVNLVCNLDFDLNLNEFTTIELVTTSFDIKQVSDMKFNLTSI